MARGVPIIPGEKAELVAIKMAPADVGRVVELAGRDGITKSEFIRLAVLDRLEREQGPPERGG